MRSTPRSTAGVPSATRRLPAAMPGHRGPAHEAQGHRPGPVAEHGVGADPGPLVGDDGLDLPGHRRPPPWHQRRDGGGAAAHVLSLASASLSCSTFTKGEPRKPSGMPCVCWLIRLLQAGRRDPRGLRDHRDLRERVLRRDVGVQTAPRRGHQVGRRVDAPAAPVRHQVLRVVQQLLRAWTEVGRARTSGDAVRHQGVVAGVADRAVTLELPDVGVRAQVVGTSLEHATAQGVTGAARLRPVLADEPRTVRRDGAVCLAPEEGLGDPGAGEGVQEAEEDSEDQDRDDRAAEMVII